MSSNRAHVLVEGHVQGVFFREFTRQRALELGLRGFAKNLPDGRVEIYLEGEPSAVQAALDFVRIGPPLARVSRVSAHSEEVVVKLTHSEGFRVL